MPFMDPDPDIDMPAIDDPDPEEEVPGDATAALLDATGTMLTASGTSTTAMAAPTALTGCSAAKRAAGVGTLARPGTMGQTDRPIRAIKGPLLGSVPPKVKSSPNPWPVTQYNKARPIPRPM